MNFYQKRDDETEKLLGIISIEFSKEEIISLLRGFEEKIKFMCTDEELLRDESSLNTLMSSIPKEELIKKAKEIRPDLSQKFIN